MLKKNLSKKNVAQILTQNGTLFLLHSEEADFADGIYDIRMLIEIF